MKLVIWDFDNTIANTHVRDYNHDTFQYLSDTNWPLLVQRLVSKGIKVGIASFNHQDLILSYVQDWAPGYFEKNNVIGNDGVSGDKLSLVKKIMKNQGVFDEETVVFFDDDFNNILQARESRVIAYHVDGEGGFKVNRDWTGLMTLL